MGSQVDSSVIEQLSTENSKALHDLIDRLTSCGIGRIVDLPQIVVVGEQSAGKSSVLEAISHVRFPVKADVCTRVATELVLRRAATARVEVSVRSDNNPDPIRTFQRTNFAPDDLAGIIDEAKKDMMPKTDSDFSKDVLRIEIEGKGLYPLTLVDLPGIFHTSTATQSFLGKQRVDELVSTYVRNKNSIILAVVSADRALAAHSILRIASIHDPHGERTLGVITKPDVETAGATIQAQYLQLARNEEASNKLKLGWHVLRNRADNETDLEERDSIEQHFFANSVWGSLPTTDQGIQTLREKLSKLLFTHVRTKLPVVLASIETELGKREKEHRRLGKPRLEIPEMRFFLTTIAEEFQRLVRDGMEGRYSDDFFQSEVPGPRKLRSELRNYNRMLDFTLRTKGSSQKITRDNELGQVETAPHYLPEGFMRYHYNFPLPKNIGIKAFRVEVERKGAASQGRELPGMPNHGLIMQLFKKQSAPWEKIARFHVRGVTLVAKAFVDQLFEHIIGPPESNATADAILSTQVDQFFCEKEAALGAKIAELLRPYKEGYALPLDSRFRRMGHAKLTDNIRKTLQSMVAANELDDSTRKLIEGNLKGVDSDEGTEFGTDKAIEMMESFYELSRETFTDNLINLAVESCLICSLPEILTSADVSAMSDEGLKRLAKESASVTSRRKQLESEIEALKNGRDQCRRYIVRHITALSTSAQQPRIAAKDTPKASSFDNPLTVRKAPWEVFATTTAPKTAGQQLSETATQKASSNLFSGTSAQQTPSKVAPATTIDWSLLTTASENKTTAANMKSPFSFGAGVQNGNFK